MYIYGVHLGAPMVTRTVCRRSTMEQMDRSTRQLPSHDVHISSILACIHTPLYRPAYSVGMKPSGLADM